MDLMQILTSPFFTLFLLHSYIIGWLFVAKKATEWPYAVDLCHLLRYMFLAPIPVALIWIVSVILSNSWLLIMIIVAMLIGSVALFGALGYFVVRPIANKVANKTNGILESFHNKFCVTLYKN